MALVKGLYVTIRPKDSRWVLGKFFPGRTRDDLSDCLRELWTERYGSPGRGKRWGVGLLEHFSGGNTYWVQMGYRYGNGMTLEPRVVVVAEEVEEEVADAEDAAG